MKIRTPSERFWAKVDRSSDCWIWGGFVQKTGYGQFSIRKTHVVSAHRFAYEDVIGPIPEGLAIDHTCHKRSCVRPDHLRAVTHKQNMENHNGPQRTNRQGARNVGFDRSAGMYIVRVMHHGKSHSGGSFKTLEEAAEAAQALRLSLHTHNDADRAA